MTFLLSLLKIIVALIGLMIFIAAAAAVLCRASTAWLPDGAKSVTGEISVPVLSLTCYGNFSNTRILHSIESSGDQERPWRETGDYYAKSELMMPLYEMKKQYHVIDNMPVHYAVVTLTYKKNFLGKNIVTSIEIVKPGFFAGPK